ncbi:unnamed protein product, partial [marine sediment metagenome]
MSDKRVKTLTLALKISITLLVLVALLISLISCNGLREVSSYITHTIKEKSKDNAGEEEDKTKNNMRGEEIMLPQPELESNISLEEALNSRRSVRNFSSKELSLNQIS